MDEEGASLGSFTFKKVFFDPDLGLIVDVFDTKLSMDFHEAREQDSNKNIIRQK